MTTTVIMKNLLLLDGANLMMRARFSAKRFGKGDHAVVYSFFRSLRPIVEKFYPNEIILALEGVPAKRLDLHGGYKGTRERIELDDGYGRQRQEIIELLKLLPVKVVRHPMREADDVIAHYARLGAKKGHQVTVVSSDADFTQLLPDNDNIKIYNPISKKFRDLPHDDYVGWKSLVGDSSDNIIGFHGVGNKRACSLLESPDKLKKFLDKESGWEKYETNRKLVEFEHVPHNEISVIVGSLDPDALKQRFQEFEFWSVINKTAWPKYVSTFEGVENE